MEFPKSPSKDKRFANRKWMLGVGATVLITMLPLLGFHLESGYSKGRVDLNAMLYYIVVVDCGSTRTRVNVYEWKVVGVSSGNLSILLISYPDNATKSSLWKSSCQYHCMQTEPGLDKFVNDSLGVRNALIVWAENVVPLEQHRETHVFVLGTVGLRRLPKGDAEQGLEDVENVVKGHSFMYRKSWIRVLSGREEAYYGWVALNYRMGRFDGYPEDPTLGLLDLGGLSLQIVVEVRVGDGDDVHVMRSKISSIEHQVMAYSLPTFSLNEAFDRTVLMLRNNQTMKGIGSIFDLRHLCLMCTFAQNYTCNSCSRFDATYRKKS